MTALGYASTVPVTMDEMVHHAKAISRGVKRAILVGDLPLGAYHASAADAVDSAMRMVKEGGADVVKIEGGEDFAPMAEAVIRAGIPVMAHVGLKPQSIRALGSYRVQRSHEIVEQAKEAEHAGAFAIVFECMASDLAREATAALSIPTIGIGAGPHCDGQVLVFHDLVGLTAGRTPKFVKKYADVRSVLKDAVAAYADEVRRGAYPDSEHAYE